MEHLVRFTTAEGREGTHTAATLDDAVQFVERLRNTEEAAGVRLYRLHEIPIEFKTYYKVEVRGDVTELPVAGPAVPAGHPATGIEPLVATPPAAGEGDPDGAGRRLFSRS